MNDGQTGAVCAQANPYWEEITSYELQGADAATLEYVAEELAAVEGAFTIDSIPQSYGNAAEDCLFLDVVVPESVYTQNTSAPVLVWVYGGGYVNGDKNSAGNPATLISTAQENGGEGVIYVAMNYRLGLFVSFIRD